MGMEQLIPNPAEHMEYLAMTYLPLATWGFKESYRAKKELIFDSRLCRISFVWGNWEMYTSYNLSIYYGRLHAPNAKNRLDWNGVECRCWHSLFGTSPVLDYLDGLTPQESADGGKSLEQTWAQVGVIDLQKQWEVERRKDERLTLVVEMKMWATIWDYYGLRLFELFDLRKPELWEKYRLWLREQYVAKGMDEERDKQFGITVPYYQVC